MAMYCFENHEHQEILCFPNGEPISVIEFCKGKNKEDLFCHLAKKVDLVQR